MSLTKYGEPAVNLAGEDGGLYNEGTYWMKSEDFCISQHTYWTSLT